MYRRSPRGWAKHWDFIFIDTICLQISFILAYWFRWNSLVIYYRRNAYRTTSIVLLLLGIFVAIFFNTMHNVLTRGLWEEIKNTVIQSGFVFAGIVAVLFSAKDSNHVSRIVIYLTMILYAVIGLTVRLLYKGILLGHRKVTRKREMLLVGDEKGILRARTAFDAHPEEGVNIKTVVRVDGTGDVELENAADFIRSEWIDEVYIAVVDPVLIPATLISQCSEMAVTVHQQIFMGENINDHQLVERIAKQPVLTTSVNIPGSGQLFVKRAADIVAGAFLSVLSIILLLILTPVIKIMSPGPVILKYERIGLNGRKFEMYSIRTMHMDAAVRKDPVIKGIGSFLRNWSLDELPKGFNVLLGQMSLVGTRAPSVEEWEEYQYRHRARLACKPGITGLWQVCGGGKTMSFEEATKIDTEYITNWSPGLDLRILFTPVTLRKQFLERISETK